MVARLIVPAISTGRETRASDVQLFIKRYMARNVTLDATTGAPTAVAWVADTGTDRDVLRIDATSKTPPEATDPTTYTIPTDDISKIYPEEISGRPTLGTGSADIVYDGSVIELIEDWKYLAYGDNNMEKIICSIAMYSTRTGALRIYPRIELLSVTAGAASSENAFMPATLNFARRERARYEGAYTVYNFADATPPSGNSPIGAAQNKSPSWSLDSVGGAKTYAALLTLYTVADTL